MLHEVALVGGDTVKGPLVVTVQIAGWVERDRWLTRSGAQPGDLLFVSGVPGEAAAGLAVIQQALAGESIHRSICDNDSCGPSRGLRWADRCARSRAPRWIFPTAC